jgi:GNAT superfamily N-acetyltransferase
MFLRPAIPQDALAVARVHVRSWQVAYRTLLPSAYLDQLRPEDRASKYDFASTDPLKPCTIVAAEEESILGFATTIQSHDADLGSHGELLALYVDPDSWNRGIGVALIAEARARLLDLGLRQASLWLLKGNERADRFYRVDGWTPDGTSRTDTVWDIQVDEIRYRRELP